MQQAGVERVAAAAWSDLPAVFTLRHLSSGVDCSIKLGGLNPLSGWCFIPAIINISRHEKSNVLLKSVTSLYDVFVVGSFNLSTEDLFLCLD